jgi:hypothetical protein
MSQFLMILHDTTRALAGISPEEMQRVVERYRVWSTKVAEAGKLRGGQKLKDEGGKHLTREAGKYVVRDGPFSEVNEVIGGYFLIEAADYKEAVAICADCPHLDLKGRIELREVDVM